MILLCTAYQRLFAHIEKRLKKMTLSTYNSFLSLAKNCILHPLLAKDNLEKKRTIP